MSFAAKILADSISPEGVRLTTLEITFPRMVLAEFNTHRVFSRNSASSRAIPVEKMLARVQENPFVPDKFPRNGPGMQPAGFLEGDEAEAARAAWLGARDNAVASVEHLSRVCKVHKEVANRLLEPWLWHTVIVTATEWSNWFALRCHEAAQRQIRLVALLMQGAMTASSPASVPFGGWHLPLVPDLEQLRSEWMPDATIARIACARCARVSYLTHDGKREVSADLDLADKLQASGHMSPFEHAAKAVEADHRSGNFRGWMQYRKTLAGEEVFRG